MIREYTKIELLFIEDWLETHEITIAPQRDTETGSTVNIRDEM